MKITIEHYSTDEIEDNWKVFGDGKQIGQLHDIDGIGGEIGEYTETEYFNKACNLAEMDLYCRKDVRQSVILMKHLEINNQKVSIDEKIDFIFDNIESLLKLSSSKDFRITKVEEGPKDYLLIEHRYGSPSEEGSPLTKTTVIFLDRKIWQYKNIFPQLRDPLNFCNVENFLDFVIYKMKGSRT